MNKYEQWQVENGARMPVRLIKYQSQDEVRIGDMVWDTYHQEWTTIVSIEIRPTMMITEWDNGNGAGWSYLSANHRPRE